VLVSPDG